LLRFEQLFLQHFLRFARGQRTKTKIILN